MSIILICIILFSVLAIGFQIYIWNEKKKDKSVIDDHWRKFLKADLINDIEGIKNYGDKLVWNRHIETKQLNRIMKAVNSRVEQYPELEKLSNAIFNKNRHLNRPLPY